VATFNGKNYPIGDNSSLAYIWEKSDLTRTDTISAEKDNDKGGCKFTISHPEKAGVSDDSIRATINATVKYMDNKYKDQEGYEDYEGFTFSINPKTVAFRYSVAQELFKYTPAYAKENADASFYAKQLESIKIFKISGVEIDKAELSKYESAAALNEFLTKKIEEAQNVEQAQKTEDAKKAKEAQKTVLQHALGQSRSE
jgi:hypothetical protein